MLVRTDPFRELDRLTQQVLGTAARPAAMPMDAYRKSDTFYIHFDLPGVSADSIELTVEQNVLTVRAQRRPEQVEGAEMLVAERPAGVFTRQVFLGDTLDADSIAADYSAGILTLTIPVHEQAKPRTIAVTGHEDHKQVTAYRHAPGAPRGRRPRRSRPWPGARRNRPQGLASAVSVRGHASVPHRPRPERCASWY